MNIKKIIPSGLAIIMALSMTATPVLAETEGRAIIDNARTGTINIHKLIENNGKNDQAYGLANPEESRIPVNNIGYDYKKVATIENVRGIVISEDGDIAWDADGGEVSVGTYYKAWVDGEGRNVLDELIEQAKVIPKPVYIKTSIVGDETVAPTIQYEYADQKAADLLVAEQAAVAQARDELAESRRILGETRKTNSVNIIGGNDATSAAAQANAAWLAAQQAQADAQAKYDALKAELDQAILAQEQASADLDEAINQAALAQAAFDSAETSYLDPTDGTLASYQSAQENFLSAQNSLTSAQQASSNAEAELAKASEAAQNAQDALTAAENILAEASAAHQRALLGYQDSIDATNNAVTYATQALENAKTYSNAMSTAQSNASAASAQANSDAEEAQAAYEIAEQDLTDAQNANQDAYDAYKDAKNALKDAKDQNATAQQSADDAQASCDTLTAQTEEANTALEDAKAKTEAAELDYNTKQDAANQAQADAEAQQGVTNNAQADYDGKWGAYMEAVRALDRKARENGIEKYYTAASLQDMLQQILTTLGEAYINKWVADNTDYHGDAAGKHTDDNGNISFTGLDLGLYVVAETDITYHDGLAGAWNDSTEEGYINNDQQNRYSAGEPTGKDYVIYPIDGHADTTEHHYSYGEAYRESVNPEYPVVESPSAPVFVSVPTTNMKDTTAAEVAKGDNAGEVGTVWQYTLDIYPKNQTTGVYLRIVDPDEHDNFETLRTSEDYQMGDVIEQILWGEAPNLQPNYLDPDNPDAGNKHTSYILSVKEQPGITFDQVTGVEIIPASQLKGENNRDRTTVYYYDPDGNLVTADEALDENGQPKTITKYYDSYGHEVSAEVFNEASNLNTKQDLYHTETFTYKRYESIGNMYTGKMAENANEFKIFQSAEDDEGIALTQEDYNVVLTDTNNVQVTDWEDNVHVAIPAGTHGFAVVLTESGLEKLNRRTTDSLVVVYFDSILNPGAAIGQTPENTSVGTLTWINTNTGFKQIKSNEIYDYTYELMLKKEGVDDATNVKFVVSRDDTGDVNPADEKDQTDMDSYNAKKNTGAFNYGQDDSMRFVQDTPGHYHVWSYLTGDNTAEADGEAAYETSTINGKVFNTVTPAADGTLIIKGLDSDSYTFKEIQTEPGKNLLKDTFTVKLLASDADAEEPQTNTRDGRLKEATVRTGDQGEIGITIGAQGTGGNDSMENGGINQGIASMVINNYSVVDLRTGGEGRVLIIAIGGGLLAAMVAGYVIVSRKKKKNAENQ